MSAGSEAHWISHQTEAIGAYCRELVDGIRHAVESGEDATASKHAQELGRVVGLLGMRAFSLQVAATALSAGNPTIERAVARVLTDSRLPTES